MYTVFWQHLLQHGVPSGGKGVEPHSRPKYGACDLVHVSASDIEVCEGSQLEFSRQKFCDNLKQLGGQRQIVLDVIISAGYSYHFQAAKLNDIPARWAYLMLHHSLGPSRTSVRVPRYRSPPSNLFLPHESRLVLTTSPMGALERIPDGDVQATAAWFFP